MRLDAVGEPVQPDPSVADAPPTPSSETSITSVPLSRCALTATFDACACLTTFASASHATKYAVTSTSAGNRSVVASTVTGIGTRAASASSADESPACVSAPGWMPCASDRSSSTATWSSSAVDARSRSSSGSASAPRPSLGAPQLERERDEALLGAVVEVALDAPPLRVGRGRDPGPRLLHRLELRAHLRVEPRVHERDARGGGDRLDELRLLPERRIVDEHGERLALVLDPASPPESGRLPAPRARPGGVHVLAPPAARARARASGRRARARARRGCRRTGVSLEMDDEIADVHACEPGTEETGEERERERDQGDDLPPEEVRRRSRAGRRNVRTPSRTARSATATAASRSGARMRRARGVARTSLRAMRTMNTVPRRRRQTTTNAFWRSLRPARVSLEDRGRRLSRGDGSK